MEMNLSCCVRFIFRMGSRHHFVPSWLPHSERCLWLMIWTVSPFIFMTNTPHFMTRLVLCCESSWRNVYKSHKPLPDLIFSSTHTHAQIQKQNTDSSCVFQLVLSNSEWFMKRQRVQISKKVDLLEYCCFWTLMWSYQQRFWKMLSFLHRFILMILVVKKPEWVFCAAKNDVLPRVASQS